MFLVLVGLNSRQASSYTDHIGRFSRPLTKIQCYYSVTNAFQSVFRVKHIVRRVIEARKIGTSCFLCQSLLVFTILNDMCISFCCVLYFSEILYLMKRHALMQVRAYRKNGVVSKVSASKCTRFTRHEYNSYIL